MITATKETLQSYALCHGSKGLGNDMTLRSVTIVGIFVLLVSTFVSAGAAYISHDQRKKSRLTTLTAVLFCAAYGIRLLGEWIRYGPKDVGTISSAAVFGVLVWCLVLLLRKMGKTGERQ